MEKKKQTLDEAMVEVNKEFQKSIAGAFKVPENMLYGKTNYLLEHYPLGKTTSVYTPHIDKYLENAYKAVLPEFEKKLDKEIDKEKLKTINQDYVKGDWEKKKPKEILKDIAYAMEQLPKPPSYFLDKGMSELLEDIKTAGKKVKIPKKNKKTVELDGDGKEIDMKLVDELEEIIKPHMPKPLYAKWQEE